MGDEEKLHDFVDTVEPPKTHNLAGQFSHCLLRRGRLTPCLALYNIQQNIITTSLGSIVRLRYSEIYYISENVIAGFDCNSLLIKINVLFGYAQFILIK